MKMHSFAKKNLFRLLALFPLLTIALAVGGCKAKESESFSIADYFPLSSDWETDTWTLFTDELTKQINSTFAIPVIDTSRGKAFYWSNDENGIRLHAIWSPESQMVYFSAALQIADPVCRIGDRWQTIFTRSDDPQTIQYVFTSELLESNAITTASGTYADCLRFRLHLYPLGGSPEDYGYETVWLGMETGFVRAEADDHNLSELFVEKGKARQLIRFSAIPATMTDAEMEVRAAYKQWIRFWNDKDLFSIAYMTHDEYYESCRDKDGAVSYWQNLLDERLDYSFFATIEDIKIDGNTAYVVSEFLEVYTDQNGENANRRWGRSSVRMVKNNNGWQIYGNQFDVYPSWISVYPRVTPSGAAFALPVEIVDCATGKWAETPDQIAGLQVSGPPNSGLEDLELVDNWDPDQYWSGFWTTLDISTAKNGFYTFHVTDINGNYLLYTDYLSAVFTLAAPELTSPDDGVSGVPPEVAFEWQAVTRANGYVLEVFEVDPYTGELGEKVVHQSTSQTAYSVLLDSGKIYDWRIRARYYDPNDGDLFDSESRSAFRRLSTGSIK
jgi:ketosteroid isomerase-like protein